MAAASCHSFKHKVYFALLSLHSKVTGDKYIIFNTTDKIPSFATQKLPHNTLIQLTILKARWTSV